MSAQPREEAPTWLALGLAVTLLAAVLVVRAYRLADPPQAAGAAGTPGATGGAPPGPLAAGTHRTDPQVVAPPSEVARPLPAELRPDPAAARPPPGPDRPALRRYEDLPGRSPALDAALEQVGAGQPRPALEIARGLLAGPGASAAARVVLAAALQELGQGQEAARAYREALSAEPGFAEGWGRLGTLLAELGRTGEALAAFDRALGLLPRGAPERATVLFDRGIARGNAGQLDEAVSDVWRSIALEPRGDRRFYDLAALYAQRHDAARAVAMLRFAARDAELFAQRFCQRYLRRSDTSFRPLWRDPTFLRYLQRLPRRCPTTEPDASP